MINDADRAREVAKLGHMTRPPILGRVSNVRKRDTSTNFIIRMDEVLKRVMLH